MLASNSCKSSSFVGLRWTPCANAKAFEVLDFYEIRRGGSSHPLGAVARRLGVANCAQARLKKAKEARPGERLLGVDEETFSLLKDRF